MPKVTSYTRKRIACLHKEGFYPVQIWKALRRENLQGSLASVTRIVNKIQKTGSTENRPRSGRSTKLPADAKAFVEKQMRINDEATSIQIKKQLAKRGIVLNSSTVRRPRAKQGWTLQRTHYCQLIRVANKVKRLEYAQQILDSSDTFHNVIFSDEFPVSLEQYRRTCYRKVDEPSKRKPKPKTQHPLKVHVWAGISRKGATKVCIFDGIMNAELYCRFLETTLLPFINQTLPDHRFMQDNDPKHIRQDERGPSSTRMI